MSVGRQTRGGCSIALADLGIKTSEGKEKKTCLDFNHEEHLLSSCVIIARDLFSHFVVSDQTLILPNLKIVMRPYVM